MDHNEIIDIILKEGEIYLRNLAVPLTITLVISFFILRGTRNYDLAKLRSQHRDRVIGEILSISHSYNEFLDMFHIRSKYNPQLIETLSERLALEMSNLSGLSAVYFAKPQNIEKLKTHLTELRSLYTLLVGRKEPFQPVSLTEYVKFQEEFQAIVTELMRTVRLSKLM